LTKQEIPIIEDSTKVPTQKEIWKNLLRLSWPAAVELTFASVITMVTMILVASIGREAVSAVGVTGQLTMLPWVAIQALSVGGMAVAARCIGMGNREQTRSASEQTILLSLFFSILFAAILYIWGGPMMKLMGATPDYYDMAELYMRYSAIGVFFQSMSTVVSSLMRSAGKTRISMYFNVVSNITNVLLGLILINGIGPIPQMGILGAAIAGLAARIVGCVMAVWILFSDKKLPICPRIRYVFMPNLDTIKRVVKIGIPSALEQAALRVGLIAFTMYVINLGTAEFAAHNITGSIHTYVVNFGSAIGIALVSAVGQNLGAKRPDIAQMYFAASIKLSFAVSVILIVPFLMIPEQIARLFTDDQDVIRNIVIAVRILAGFTTGQILQMAISGGLRGGGDTKWPLISTMVGVLGMRMILGYFFIVVFQWGIAGAWLCWLLDQCIRAVLIYIRYKGGKWKTVRV